MRPVRLLVEGFTAFRTAQEVVFAGLELFAIAGATGAGKSTLLDAMMYALFGKIPRLGGVGYQEIIAHGAARLAVTFDFQVRGKVYRAVRALKRGGQTSAQLEELDPASGETRAALADKVKEVDRRIEAILGLDFVAFAQAVVLPQGEFQAFLKAPAGERRKMLSRLLRLERYEAMRAEAAKRASSTRQRIDGIERRLADDYGALDPERIAQMRTQLAALEQQVETRQADLGEADAALAQTRVIAARTADLARRTTEQAALATGQPAVDADRARLTAARQAVGLREVFAALTQATTTLQEADAAVGAARATYDDAATAAKATAAALEAAELAAAGVPALRQQIARLDEVVGLQASLQDATRRLETATREAQAEQAKLTAARAALPAAEARATQARQTLATATAALAKVGYAPERADALARLTDVARQLAQLTAACATLRDDLATATDQRKTARDAHDAALAAAAAADATLAQAIDDLRAADAAREQELRTHHALALRKDLHPGDPCPVCEQPARKHAPVPPEAFARLDAAETTRAHAAGAVETARTRAQAAANAASATKEKLRHADEHHARLHAQLAAGDATLTTATQHLAATAGATRLDPPLPTTAEAILTEERALASRRAAWDRGQRQQQDAKVAVVEAEGTRTAVADAVRAAEEATGAAEQRRGHAEAESDSLRAKVTAVAGAEEPSVLRRKLARKADDLTQALATTRDAVAGKDGAVSVAAATLAAADKQRKAAAKAHATLAAGAADRARAAGFASEADAHAATLDDAAMRGLEERVQAHDARCAVVAQQLAELRQGLGERRATPADVVTAEAAKGTATQALREVADARTRLHTELRRAETDLQKAIALRKDLEVARAEAEVFGTLARELQTDGFLDFLLQESIRKLVTGASIRLRELSDRYSLETRSGDFLVVDHDNADEQRSVDTLSGGETFLVSLALALELSAQIQATAGAVELDSIFIDEGFGTLDAETLEAVAGAIESLPHSGRMVGIITHVVELTERMPARILVEKGADSSRVRLVAG